MVVWVHPDHGKEVFEAFCQLLSKEEQAAIEIVAGDGAKWIDTCTKEYFPNATRCVDFFHVVEWANEALDDVRSNTAAKARQEYTRQKEVFRKEEADLKQHITDSYLLCDFDQGYRLRCEQDAFGHYPTAESAAGSLRQPKYCVRESVRHCNDAGLQECTSRTIGAG